MVILGVMMMASLAVSLVVLLVSLVLAFSKVSDFEKASPFECGFIPHSPARSYFSFHFFSISLLFLVFDVELVLLFPLLLSTNLFSHPLILGFFISVLGVGTLWEWSQKMLKWSE